jgi:dynein heavy chain
MKSQVLEWQQKCKKLATRMEEEFPDTAEVARRVAKDQLDNFAQYLPMIRCFLEESVTNEDWDEIKNVVEPQVPGIVLDQADIVVKDHIIENDLLRYVGEIEDITMRAEKKFGLRKKLLEYKKEMRDFPIAQKPYKDGSTHILKNFDDIMTKLDDVIVGTQTMLGSSYMKGILKSECQTWERKLNDASELMEAMMKTQRDWMYLEPIFSSGDIGQTMPVEYKKFMEVDAHWRKTQDTIHETPEVMYVSEQDGLRAQFDQQNRNLSDIQKALAQYLEEKRLIFARFFFLGSDELLQILANTKDPTLVQPYMNKCFEGINSIKFDEN